MEIIKKFGMALLSLVVGLSLIGTMAGLVFTITIIYGKIVGGH